MKASDLMTRDVRVCSREDSLEQAARTMWESDIGCLVVVDAERRPVGMITDRDIAMAAYTQGVLLRDAHVWTAMSAHVVSCSPGMSLADLESRMRTTQVRRLPVVDAEGQLVGIVALGDIARSSQSSVLRKTESPGLARTLASITAPRATDGAATP